MKYIWKREINSSEEEFIVIVEGLTLTGTYNKNKYSTLEYTKSKLMDGTLLKKNWWAQEGYMSTDPKQQGLGYMMSYAAANTAISEEAIAIYISSGSVDGGGSALIKKLGGVFYKDIIFISESNESVNYPGYVIAPKTMLEKAQEGWKKNNWLLI